MGLEKINLKYRNGFCKFSIFNLNLKFLKKKILLDFFILNVMVLQCVVIQIYRLSFQLY
jgi:hypothetical protein